jgi:hypothetical protein
MQLSSHELCESRYSSSDALPKGVNEFFPLIIYIFRPICLKVGAKYVHKPEVIICVFHRKSAQWKQYFPQGRK